MNIIFEKECEGFLSYILSSCVALLFMPQGIFLSWVKHVQAKYDNMQH